MKTTNTYNQILNRMAIETGQSQPVIGKIVHLFLEGVEQKLLNGEKVKLGKFGTLHVGYRNNGQSDKRAKALNGTVFKTKFIPSRIFKNEIVRNKEKILEKEQAN